MVSTSSSNPHVPDAGPCAPRERASSAGLPRSHQPLWETLAAVFVAAIAHHPVISAVFYQDDLAILNASKVSVESFEHGILHMILHRPFLTLTMYGNWWLGGLNPVGYHVFNLIGHLLAVAGVYAVVSSLLMHTHRSLRRAGLRDTALAPGWNATRSYLPLYAALLFAVHPVATEPVAYVMARANGWGGAFFLWTWALAAQAIMPDGGLGRETIPTSRRVELATGALLFAVLSSGFKEIHLLYLPLIPLSVWLAVPPVARKAMRTRKANAEGAADAVAVERAKRARRRLLLLAAGTLAAFTGLLALIWNNIAGILEMYTYSGRWADAKVMLLSQIPVTLWNWLRIPFPYKVSLEYDFVFRRQADAVFYACIAGHLLLLGAAAWWGRRRPWVRIAVLWYYFTLAPSNSIIPRYDIWSDRNAYLACAAGCVLLAGLFQEAASRLSALGPYARPVLRGRGLAAAALLALWLGTLSVLTYRRDALYSNEIGFWRETTRLSPRHPRAHLQLARLLDDRGETEDAVKHYKETIRLCNSPEEYIGHLHRDTWLAMAQTRLALLAKDKGDIENALGHLEEAFESNPFDLEIVRELVYMYLQVNDPSSARQVLEEVDELAELSDVVSPMSKEMRDDFLKEIRTKERQIEREALQR